MSRDRRIREGSSTAATKASAVTWTSLKKPVRAKCARPPASLRSVLWVASDLPDPPVNTTLPQIIGDPEVGEQLVAGNGSWTGASSYGRQWFRGVAAIVGATGVG